MRIIAGVAKGRTLSSVAGATRPTSDRAREGLFSSLISEFGDFLGLNFLDLFAGSGAIGLESNKILCRYRVGIPIPRHWGMLPRRNSDEEAHQARWETGWSRCGWLALVPPFLPRNAG